MGGQEAEVGNRRWSDAGQARRRSRKGRVPSWEINFEGGQGSRQGVEQGDGGRRSRVGEPPGKEQDGEQTGQEQNRETDRPGTRRTNLPKGTGKKR